MLVGVTAVCMPEPENRLPRCAIQEMRLMDLHGKLVGLASLFVVCGLSQGADWLTDGGNQQRTAWQKDEKILSKSNVKDMKLLWKIHLDNEPRQMHSLFPPLIVEKVNTPNGVKEVAIDAGVSDNLFAIDVETGQVIWKKHFENTWTPP